MYKYRWDVKLETGIWSLRLRQGFRHRNIMEIQGSRKWNGLNGLGRSCFSVKDTLKYFCHFNVNFLIIAKPRQA